MTGLNPAKHVILEIASIVTDDDLKIIAEGPNIAIYHPEKIMMDMETWSREHHKASGLLDRVYACGNSIWQDRRFLMKYMPKLGNYFHYRNIDVSSIKELAKRWYPSLPPYEKKKPHLALMDIKESINELKYYRKKVFIPGL
jgi:oligoribonuclease